MVAVFVKENVKEGMRDAYVEYMQEAIRLTKLEDGNIAYDLYEPADEPGGCAMIEVWESKEALDRHMQSEHFKKYIPGGDAYKTAPSKIQIFERL
ncbi:MAG: antibiotic biosynthesis monooxygenase [Clostridiales Family XIII bacterium]|jgi:quinol monooxygenase YgiN|nr:antibiotic biosynthesis monooxygenase [Clostridiales Family XIII bacterium]